jgi:Zn-dependent protease/CBS domain-containing protein
MAIIASILFFTSVLAHELAHSLASRARGIPVRRITLFLFGGVSNIQREPKTPMDEFLVTIVGPVTSLVIGALFILFSGVTPGALTETTPDRMNALADFGPVTTLLLWIGPINIVLGIFNLIPGFPLDGGRILRSLLWAITENLKKATQWASYVGQGIAWLMIGSGFAMIFGVQIPFLGTGLVSGLWIAFIGWFLHSAAVSSYRRIVIRDILEDVPVSYMMRRDAPTVSPDSSVSDLVHDRMMRTDEHAFPVKDAGRLVGLVTLDDVRNVSRERWETTTIRDIMTPAPELEMIRPDEDASDALQKLQAKDIRQLPVLEDSRLVGLLRRRDIVKWLQLHSNATLS